MAILVKKKTYAFWNIPKRIGDIQKGEKMEYSGFLGYSGIFQFLILGLRRFTPLDGPLIFQ